MNEGSYTLALTLSRVVCKWSPSAVTPTSPLPPLFETNVEDDEESAANSLKSSPKRERERRASSCLEERAAETTRDSTFCCSEDACIIVSLSPSLPPPPPSLSNEDDEEREMIASSEASNRLCTGKCDKLADTLETSRPVCALASSDPENMRGALLDASLSAETREEAPRAALCASQR